MNEIIFNALELRYGAPCGLAMKSHCMRFALSNVDFGFVNIVAPTVTPAPVPVADVGIGGIEAEVAGAALPPYQITSEVRVVVV